MDYKNIDDYRGDVKERLTRIETILIENCQILKNS